jgi:hypothetical protein
MLGPPLAALFYPFALEGFNTSVTHIGASGASTLWWLSAAACLALAFAMPLIAMHHHRQGFAQSLVVPNHTAFARYAKIECLTRSMALRMPKNCWCRATLRMPPVPKT